ncbi:putative quinol monooxygenase [Planomonospora alba]|uniref:Quinol monooxygenase n=1 Tax=Planomonospora alba TaxID=161354 RepID=A0ABP6MU72_9ACTN
MLLSVVKFTVRPEQDAAWLSLIEDFTKATRAEPGNVLIEWSKSVDDPHRYVVIEGYTDPEALAAHTDSEHFRTTMAALPDMTAGAPEMLSAHSEHDGWSPIPADPHQR